MSGTTARADARARTPAPLRRLLLVCLAALPAGLGCEGAPGESVDLILDVVAVAEPDPLGAGEADFKVASLDLVGLQEGQVLFRQAADVFDEGAGLTALDLRGLTGAGADLDFPLEEVTLLLSGFNAIGALVAQGATEPVRLVVGEPVRASLLFARVDTGSRLAAALAQPRWGHTATPLGDGRLLVFGGAGGLRDGQPTEVLAAPEIVDLTTGEIRALEADGLTARIHHSATPVAGGVLVLGGLDAGGAPLGTAVLFDAVHETFGSEFTVSPRAAHAAAARGDGVVVAGGVVAGGEPEDALAPLPGPVQIPAGLGATDSVEFIQLAGEAVVAPLAPLAGGARAFPAAAALGDGVVVAGGLGPGGVSAAVDWYPQSDSGRQVGALGRPRMAAAAATLAGGVLVSGGTDDQGTPLGSGSLVFLAGETSPEVGDAPAMAGGRSGFGLVALGAGRAVALGGQTTPATVGGDLALASRIEEYDPAAGFAETGALRLSRLHAAVAGRGPGLASICGGLAPTGGGDVLAPLSSVEIYLPAQEVPR